MGQRVGELMSQHSFSITDIDDDSTVRSRINTGVFTSLFFIQPAMALAIGILGRAKQNCDRPGRQVIEVLDS